MIGGIGALQFKPAIDGAEPGSPGLLQSGAGTQASERVAGSFAEALSHAASKTVNSLQNAEQMSIQALKGDADTRQVVDAVLSAQQALQTTIAIRDKVVSAYLEISRMNI
ncbi:flagellar hook-basal body complex protein FliE [Mesorhizobium sp.]|uniref:flagellar hook-basal body complex protein FliE n=1 Tax=Mesorhizobium sp. TaxID=1871066 RepID=UPI000FE3061B|nr:flagellar hook-basal body complex protein FliE [Mesorhizobium sp.]RWA73894.1 MAG: flagellar hook-basal body complex protein FliE [Mesorhizobium sp.]RWC05302.1 MAG: flagellar hook-basal body complex protein FliE [Mesorhizobium sp.]RWG86727.1 MAG: flagellar hook-basal body complex protein FliE [Mesorhizobium sp.]RWG90449.1 MAG: flagellar hook-basal body complex protein FliE [Mesorhizobium sp.]RWK09529.1 MAG: flagellar hook-basal body complex protein FliE [Mesorhizobium sp.]